MNRINFDNTGGFPLGAYTLDFMQKSYQLLNALGNISGNLSILSGCEEVGRSITDGVVYINGEVLPFKGAPISEKVIIVETSQKRIFKDGVERAVEYSRYATFGNSTSGHLWADFKRPLSNQQIEAQSFTEENSLLKRLELLEERVGKTVPIGLVAIWGKPADIPLPEGWREYEPLRGRMPIGKVNDLLEDAYLAKFGLHQIGHEDGEYEHKLTIEEMPSHNHSISFNKTQDDQGFGTHEDEFSIGTANLAQTTYEGGDRPHNNMPPYRVIRFIEFVGF